MSIIMFWFHDENARPRKREKFTRTSSWNFWRKIKNAVSPISMATTKLHQKVCNLKIAIMQVFFSVQVHPFVFKKISNKSSALVPVFGANNLFGSFATTVTFRKIWLYTCPVNDIRKRYGKKLIKTYGCGSSIVLQHFFYHLFLWFSWHNSLQLTSITFTL